MQKPLFSRIIDNIRPLTGDIENCIILNTVYTCSAHGTVFVAELWVFLCGILL